jgi:tRNA A-37 threonylcarbamoyl transferase component Bud32
MSGQSQDPRERGAFFWVAILVSSAMILLYGWGSILIIRHGAWTKDAGWSAAMRGGSWVVTRVDARGPAAGRLQVGDRVVAIDGDTRVGSLDPDWVPQLVAPERSYSLSIESAGASRTVSLSMPLHRSIENLYWMASLVLVGLTFLVVAAMLGMLKPRDRLARIGFVFGIAAALHMLGVSLVPLRGVLAGSSVWLCAAASSMTFLPDAFEYHFASRFPVWIEESRIWRSWRVFLYGFAILLFARFAYVNLSLAAGVKPYIAYSPSVPGLQSTYFLLIILSVIAVMVRNYSLVTEPDLLRRIKWFTYGAALALLPVSTYIIAAFVAGISGNGWLMQTRFWYNFGRFDNISLILLPLTFGYCVIKHRVLGIDFVFRRGLQYLLAKNSLRLLLLLPWIPLASTILLHPDMSFKDLFFSSSVPFYAGTSLAAGVSMAYRKRLMHVLDRRFFRESYDREQMLLDLVDEMNSAGTVPELSALIQAKVVAAFHPSFVKVLYREPHAPSDPLTMTVGPQRSAFDPRRSSFGFPTAAAEWLAELGAHLIVPILGSDDRVIGAICLGEKQSEEPYTKTDRSTLQMIAAQFASLVENLWLRERVSVEQNIRREVLAHLGNVPSFVKECHTCGACYDSHSLICDQDGSELMLTLPVERVLESKYRLDRRIGAGSMGAVYEGYDLRLARKVVLKVMVGRLFGDKAAQRRFEREAQMLARLDHENIVGIHDFGTIEGGGAYIIMPYLPGTNLRKDLARLRSIPPDVAGRWIDQLLAGVAAAHEQGVIHRDLKPENILIARPPGSCEIVKILDFGLAKLWEGSDPNTITLAGSIVGTLGYMAPEQMLDEEVDGRTDIFALGVIVLESLNGRHPFARGSTDQVLASVQRAEIIAPNQELTTILRRCVHSDPARRYKSVAQLRSELVPAIRAYGALISAEEAGDTGTITGPKPQSKTV